MNDEEVLRWSFWAAGLLLGLLLGMVISGAITYGRAFYIRFVLKKTPIEPIIIGVGKISVPVKAVENGRFEYDGHTYVVPEGATVIKSLVTGSVSAIYFEGIPSPITTTPRSMHFKLRDNSILSPSIRSILQNDALNKMFSRQKITHLMILVALVLNIIATTFAVQMVLKGNNMVAGISSGVGSAVDSMRESIDAQISDIEDAVEDAIRNNPVGYDNRDPNAPSPIPTPPGG